MAAKTDPNSGINHSWAFGESGWNTGMDANLKKISRVGFHATVLDRDLATPPGSPSDGDAYIIASGGTGDWSGHDGKVAYWDDPADEWDIYTPAEGWKVWVADENTFYVHNGSAFTIFEGGGGGGGAGSSPGFKGASVYRSTNQTLATATATAVIFDTESYDSNAFYDGASPDRFVAPEPGYYLIIGNVNYDNTATSHTQHLQIMKNGSTRLARNGRRADANITSWHLEVCTVAYLDAGDYVTLEAYQNTGSNLDLDTTVAGAEPQFSISKIETAVAGSGFSGCHLIQTADQTVADSTTVTMELDTAVYDTDNYASLGSDEAVIPEPGYYSISAFNRWDANATGERFILIVIDGVIYTRTVDAANASTHGHMVYFESYFEAGATVSVQIRQSSGGNLNTQSGGGLEQTYSRLMIHRISSPAVPVEGEWTPTYIASGTDFDDVTYSEETAGYYQKIGKAVHITGAIRTDSITVGSASGTLQIGGLPFTADSSIAGGFHVVPVGYYNGFAGEAPNFLTTVPDAKKMTCRFTAADGESDSSANSYNDAATGNDANYLIFSGTYFTND
jgi:hypothetical protein